MDDRPIVVVGAGMAGSAAAWAAAREGRRVVVVHDRAGASALYAGTLDLPSPDAVPSRQGKREAEREAERDEDALNDPHLAAFFTALGGFRLGRGPIATSSGIVRTTYGADDALLDLTPLAGKRIAVADIGRDDWDAPQLARTLAASAWAERTHTTFGAVPVKTLRSGHERRTPPYDFAALHDDDQRRASFADALKHAADDVDAWLLGPWLGLMPETVTVLRRLVPLPVGETTSPLGGPAGARFEAARNRLLEQRHIELRSGQVTQIIARGGRWAVRFEEDHAGNDELEATAVILASGGIGAGGLLLRLDPRRGGRGFELPFQAPVALALDGVVQGGGGSLYGPSLETVGLGVLERVGIFTDADGRPAGVGDEAAGLFAAGDAVAGRPRTMLAAALAGLRTGTVAARV
jgi:glycerol-3-phosphate dehydrogenase subunit B